MARSGAASPEGAPDPAGGPLAWTYLRCCGRYRAAWRAHAARAGRPPEYEDAPFPLRRRSPADLKAEADWGLFAWADPDGADLDGAASPFWAVAPMLDGTGSAAATPLLPLLARAGARLDGLRLLDGTLLLKVEKHGAALQLRVADDAPLLAGGGVRICHDWGLALPVSIARLEDLWGVSGRPDPQERRGVGGRDRRAGSSGRC